MFLLAVIVFCYFVSNQKSFAEERQGYLIHDGFNEIPCTLNPLPDLCSFSHQVPDLTRMPQNEGSLTNVSAQMRNTLQIISGYINQSATTLAVRMCASTAQNFLCSQVFQLICTDEYIFQNLTKIRKSCKEAEQHCGNLTGEQFPFKSMINCSMPIEPMEKQKRRQFKCARFPKAKEDRFPCAKQNYKVLAINVTEQTRNLVATHERLAKYASNISQECLHDVAEAVCNLVGPVCDRNETMVASLISRQDCERIIRCLNTTSKVENLKYGLLEQCRMLPDAYTAKKIPLSLVYSEFDDEIAPITVNDTKVNANPRTKPTTENPFTNQTIHTETRHADGSRLSTSEGPYFNTTGQNTNLTATTEIPATQANKTELSTLSTEKKSTNVKVLHPKTENLQNLTKTTLAQLSSELTNPRYISATPSPFFSSGKKPSLVLNASAATPLIVLSFTATSSLVSPVGTIASDVFSITATGHSLSVEIRSTKDSGNNGAQLNTKMNGLEIVSVISILLLQIY